MRWITWRSRCSFIKSCDDIIAAYVVAPHKVNASQIIIYSQKQNDDLRIPEYESTYKSYGVYLKSALHRVLVVHAFKMFDRPLAVVILHTNIKTNSNKGQNIGCYQRYTSISSQMVQRDEIKVLIKTSLTFRRSMQLDAYVWLNWQNLSIFLTVSKLRWIITVIVTLILCNTSRTQQLVFTGVYPGLL